MPSPAARPTPPPQRLTCPQLTRPRRTSRARHSRQAARVWTHLPLPPAGRGRRPARGWTAEGQSMQGCADHRVISRSAGRRMRLGWGGTHSRAGRLVTHAPTKCACSFNVLIHAVQPPPGPQRASGRGQPQPLPAAWPPAAGAPPARSAGKTGSQLQGGKGREAGAGGLAGARQESRSRHLPPRAAHQPVQPTHAKQGR